MRGVIHIESKSEFHLKELNYHPIVAYNIQVLRNLGCDRVEFLDEHGVLTDDLIWKYDLHPAQQDVNDNPCIELLGLNPLLSTEEIQTLMSTHLGSIELIDCFGLCCGRIIGDSEKTTSITLGIKSGFVVDKIEKWQMISGLFEANLKAIDFPKVVRESYTIVERGTPGKLKMLFTAPYAFFTEDLVEQIEQNFHVTYAYQAPEAVVRTLLKDCQIWVVSTCPPYFMGAELFSLAKNLELVATPSTGTNHLDKHYLAQAKIPLLSIKESPVIEEISASSEMSLTLLVSLIKKLNTVTDAARLGTWREQEAHFRSEEFQGKRIGLVGLGRIGRNMARYAEALKMEVVYFDPNVTDANYRKLESLDSLLRTSDIVSLHYHLDEETKGAFGKSEFETMKSGSYFLNTARGELVDEVAMLEALENGHLKGAAVDVISDEHIPNKWDHPVIKYARTHPNLMVSPHVAGLTIQSESKAMGDLINQVLEFYR